MFPDMLSFFAEHWARMLAAALGVLGSAVGFVFARYAWISRNFLHKLNFSLNLEDGGVLDFMTVDEVELAHLFGAYPRFRLKLLARRARKEGRAFLLFAHDKDAWTFLNVLLNHVSRLFGAGAVARDLGCATTVEYLFGLTCEVHPALKSFKFRVMLARPELLDKIGADPALRFSEDRHNEIRRKTLLEMLTLHKDAARCHNLLTVKVAVRK